MPDGNEAAGDSVVHELNFWRQLIHTLWMVVEELHEQVRSVLGLLLRAAEDRIVHSRALTPFTQIVRSSMQHVASHASPCVAQRPLA